MHAPSFAKAAALTCPQCEHTFTAEIWLLVDGSAHPDLLSQAREGTLHTLPCPNCGHAGHVDAPLLFYLPERDPPLLFSPAQGSNQEQTQQHAMQLLGALHERLGDAWQNTWLAQGLQGIPRAMLPAALSKDPEAALREMQEQAAREGGAPAIPAPLRSLLQQAQSAAQHYLQSNDLSALDAAAHTWQQIWAHPVFNDADAAFQLAARNDGAGIFLRRYWARGDIRDLTIALTQWEACVAATPDGSPDLAGRLNNLGLGLSARYGRTGARADLERAIQVSEQAVAATPDGSPDLAMYLNNLGNGLRARYGRTGARADLERAIEAYEQAVAATPDGSPELPSRLNNLGNGLRDRYGRTGALADLERAIQVTEQAVAATPDGSPDLAMYLNNLGIGFRARYRQTGALADLEQAIQVYEEVVATTPESSPEYPRHLNNLGNGLRDRYRRMGALADLERAIQVYEQAVAATPDGAPDLPSRLNNLGNGLRDRYERTGALADLERAIQVYETVVTATPDGSPEYPRHLNNLGTGLWTRYGQTSILADLERAIEAFEAAVTATSESSPDLPGMLTNVGLGLRDLYLRKGVLADLERAIEAFEAAVTATPEGSPDLAGRLNNLGNGLRDRYGRTGALADLERATVAWQRACPLGLEVALEEALRSARNWGSFAIEQKHWQEGVTAYEYGMQAIERLYRAQILRASKEAWLKDARSVPGGAAYAHAKLEQWQEAVVALEQGRARLLSEILERDRADLAALEAQAPDIYARYVAVADKLQVLEAQDVSGQITLPPGQSLADAMRAARAELDAAIDAVRTVSGYEDFLSVPDWDDIQSAAVETPLIYVVATLAGGLVLIVDHDAITPVWLDALTDEVLREHVQGPDDDPEWGGYLGAYFAWRRKPRDRAARHAWFNALNITIAWLRDTIMQPIADALLSLPLTISPLGEGGGGGASFPLEGEGRDGGGAPITLIPTGYLALLPLHAAGEGVFTYAPNARALSAARDVVARVQPPYDLFAVDNPDGSLRFSTDEVIAALATFEDPHHLPNNKATLEAVQAAMLAHSIWHFSTHGIAGWQQPLEGNLLLADGTLTLRDILQLQGTRARLAVLSACETGIPGTELPDEVIGLPTGLLQAGIAGVVGSLWAVNDFSTALLMLRFYTAWRIEGQDPPHALHTAQRWLRESSNAHFAAYFRAQLPEFDGAGHLPHAVASAAYQHFSLARDLHARPFAHPFYWAGFYYTGI